MKKNRFVKIASAMLILCLITTCAISTTLAKYTTGSTAADTARVAKWGVEVSASGTMFGTAYQETIVKDGDESATVQSNHNGEYLQNVVAPGTKNGTGIQIKIKGTPEVEFNLQAAITTAASDIYLKKGSYGVMVYAYGVNAATFYNGEVLYTEENGVYTKVDVKNTEFDANETYYRLTDAVEVTDEYYYPITWTASVSVDGKYYEQNPAYATLAAALTGLVDGINNYDGTESTAGSFKPNTSVDLVYGLKWAWVFETDNDGADTILGNLMAAAQDDFTGTVVVLDADGNYTAPVENTDYSLQVGCGFSVTATQIN